MSFRIAGLGTALPEHSMSQSEATQLAQQVCCSSEEQSRLLAVLYRKAGVANRFTALPHRIALDWLEGDSGGSSNGNGHAVLTDSLGPSTAERMDFYQEHAFPIALRAASCALDQAGFAPHQITHLITVSCTGFAAPGVDVELINRLRLPSTTQRVNVGFMGCHGAINGLRVASALATADPQARILLAAVELCSLHYRFQWDPERFIGNALFADGAGAVVGCGSKGAAGDWRVTATGSCLLPDSTDAMTWRVGNYGFEMTLSPRVPELISQHLRPWLAEWLEQNGTSLDRVGAWAIHPGGPRILNAAEESLGLPREATKISREVLSEYGNMSSPTVLFILERLRQARAPRPCVMLGFGPGLVAEAALVE
jgi:predicted naringenin-chalcone synthase